VDVFPLDRPREASGADIVEDLRHAALDRREVLGRSTPIRASMRACASEPWMSNSARRRSKSIEALKRCVRRSIGSPKRPDHALPAGAGLSSCCMEPVAVAKWVIVASINQTGTGIRLPNFCNLGVMLRAVVVVNLFILAFAVLHGSPGDFAAEFLGFASFTEPALIVSLMLLCAARRPLHAMGYVASWVVVLLFELALAWVFFHMARGLMPGADRMPFSQVGFLTLFVAGCTLAYFDLRSRALHPAIAEARIQALQARIRPHFPLQQHQCRPRPHPVGAATCERALEDMADLFRVLMADNRTLAPLGDEIALARQYLAIEAIRLGDRLRVVWRTDGVPNDTLVPPLVLQPLIENAVYHGIEPSESGGEIAVEAARSGDSLLLTLSNPFAGTGKADGNKMALANIRERLQLHFDAEADMKSEVKDGLYRVTIRVPYLRSAP
jgi:two-component system sensor histidine kinase AlgZ